MEYKETFKKDFEENKKRIVNYWTKRSHSFSDLRQREQKAEIGQDWMLEIEKFLPEGNYSKILDVGCGTGIFALMLAEKGHQTVGIDLTTHMILHAKEIAIKQGSTAEFYVMDAEHLEFADDSFDMVVTRNLTWTLPNVEGAYREWFRVLKPGGVLLNFDADYGHDPADKDEELLPPEHAHRNISKEMNMECDAIKAELSISKEIRPQWDLELLKTIGYTELLADEAVYQRIYKVIDEFYNPTPIFMIKGRKPQKVKDDSVSHLEEHINEHVHTHAHTHEHTHEHSHAHGKENSQNLALLKYMVEHNEHHAEEIANMAKELRKAGKCAAAEELEKSVAKFEAGNAHLSKAYDILNGEN